MRKDYRTHVVLLRDAHPNAHTTIYLCVLHKVLKLVKLILLPKLILSTFGAEIERGCFNLRFDDFIPKSYRLWIHKTASSISLCAFICRALENSLANWVPIVHGIYSFRLYGRNGIFCVYLLDVFVSVFCSVTLIKLTIFDCSESECIALAWRAYVVIYSNCCWQSATKQGTPNYR